MTLHHRDQLQRAKWDAYVKRQQNPTLVDRVLTSPATFLICLAILCSIPLVAVILCLRG